MASIGAVDNGAQRGRERFGLTGATELLVEDSAVVAGEQPGVKFVAAGGAVTRNRT